MVLINHMEQRIAIILLILLISLGCSRKGANLEISDERNNLLHKDASIIVEIEDGKFKSDHKIIDNYGTLGNGDIVIESYFEYKVKDKYFLSIEYDYLHQKDKADVYQMKIEDKISNKVLYDDKLFYTGGEQSIYQAPNIRIDITTKPEK